MRVATMHTSWTDGPPGARTCSRYFRPRPPRVGERTTSRARSRLMSRSAEAVGSASGTAPARPFPRRQMRGRADHQSGSEPTGVPFGRCPVLTPVGWGVAVAVAMRRHRGRTALSAHAPVRGTSGRRHRGERNRAGPAVFLVAFRGERTTSRARSRLMSRSCALTHRFSSHSAGQGCDGRRCCAAATWTDSPLGARTCSRYLPATPRRAERTTSRARSRLMSR